jgi:hypothetical protein
MGSISNYRENKSQTGQVWKRVANRFKNSQLVRKFLHDSWKVDDNFENLKLKKSALQQRASNNSEETADENQKIETRPLLAAQIAEKQGTVFEEVNMIGRFVQHLETVLTYGILLFKNEDDVLNPILDEVDECTRILKKYVELHPLYKILCGPNYLSKLKVIIKKIVNILDNSRLKFNSPKEFLAEFKQKYPNLLYLLCESYLNDNLKKKLEFLPDSIENSLNNALDNALDKFKNKFKF